MARVTIDSIKTTFKRSILYDYYIIKKTFLEHVGYKCNLINPKSFNEITNWYKLHDTNPLYPDLIDKAKVKKHIARLIGEQHIIPTIVDNIKSVDDIPWDDLPDKFVIKCTHDSGSTIICQDKSLLDTEQANAKLKQALLRNPADSLTRARVCRKIKPTIMVEELLPGDDVVDYKMMVFNGVCKIIDVCSQRFTGAGLRQDNFDITWEHLPFVQRSPISDIPIEKPGQLQEMIELSEIIAKYVNRAFVRVDFYDVGSKVFFGEITFYHAGGYDRFYPNEYDFKLGEMIDLSHGGKIC